ncbi:hypothetical protein JB92DRAFT_3144148 [Gautieria morchelliformis]|nr:hypothetical protein JB92DRAFT_3144148 [Gautieria morchelliformis]
MPAPSEVNTCRPRSAHGADDDDDYVNTDSSQDVFLPAQRTMGKVKRASAPPIIQGRVISMTRSQITRLVSQRHPPTALARNVPLHRRLLNMRVAYHQLGPTTTARKVPMASPDSWITRPPGKSRDVRRPSPTLLPQENDPYRQFMLGILDNMDSKSLREMIKDRGHRMSQYDKKNTSELTLPSTSQKAESSDQSTPGLTAAEKEKWRANDLTFHHKVSTVNTLANRSNADELLAQQLHVELNGADANVSPHSTQYNPRTKMGSVLPGVYQL